MAKSSITWVRALREYHEMDTEKLVPFATSLRTQLLIDPIVLVANSPVTMPNYLTAINNLNTDIVARQNSRSTTLTSDELSKQGTLLHLTDLIVGYIESTVNATYPNDLVDITTVFTRFGLKPAEHGGKAQKHIFNVLKVESASATLQAPNSGEGSVYHWRWSTNQTTWTVIKATYKSTVVLSNLPVDVRVYFQYDVTPPVGRGAYPTVSATANDYSWSDTISELVPR